ncbi:MAG: anthranilate phosphoribosyltransferase, partial [Bacteroidota bacterium]
MKEILNQLIEYKTLDKQMSKEVLMNLAQGKYNQSQVSAFLTVFMMRSITVEELEGFRDAMLELCLPVEIEEYDAIDLCGTGGDGKDTFNISTLSSFIVAGAGQTVAKHGNNGVSSVCGSSNLLAYFGYQFTNNLNELKRSLDEANICFLHAPLFHPAMKNVAPIRKELGVKTFFNMLGPMVNPSFPKKQLVGVFNLELARLYGYLYQQTDKEFTILHSLDGYDEVSLTGDFKMISNLGEELVSPD